MPFVKGMSGNIKGMPKGTPTRGAKVRVTAKEILDNLGFEPFKEAVELFRTTKKEQIKCDLIIDLCNYVAPKLRSVELVDAHEKPFTITLNLAPKIKETAIQKIIENDDHEIIDV